MEIISILPKKCGIFFHIPVDFYNMLDKKLIQNRLRIAREALPGSVNPRQFALKAKGVDASQYTKFEKGLGSLSMDRIMELCSIWGINSDWILTGKGDVFITAVNNETDSKYLIKEDLVSYGTSNSGTNLTALLIQLLEKQNSLMEKQNFILERQATQIEEKVKETDERTRTMETNLNEVVIGVRTIALQVSTGREVTLEALSRLEKKPEDHLLQEADNKIEIKVTRGRTMGKSAGVGK